MSKRIFVAGGFNVSSGFGADQPANYVNVTDGTYECAALGPQSDCSHVRISAANLGDKDVIVGINSPFIGQGGSDSPLVLQSPLVIKPVQIIPSGYGYTLELFLYSRLPPISPAMTRAPKRVLNGPTGVPIAGSTQVVAVMGRRVIRCYIDNGNNANPITVKYLFALETTSVGGAGQPYTATITDSVAANGQMVREITQSQFPTTGAEFFLLNFVGTGQSSVATIIEAFD